MNTEQIITESIEEAGLVDATDDGTVETASTDDTPTDTATADDAADPNGQQPAQADTDPLLAEYGIKNKNNRIPYSRVQKIVANQVEKAKAAALAEAEALKQRYSTYETPEFTGLLDSLRVAQENPEQFLNALATADPRYKQLLEARREAARQAAQPTKVDPDVQLPDGSMGYSQEAFQRLLDARDAATAAAIEKKLAERYAPIEDRFRQAQVREGAIQKLRDKIADARTWDGFVQHEKDITAALTADKTLSLEQAYRKVVFGKLSQSREQLRAELLEEIKNAKPAASQAKPSSAPIPGSGKPQTIEDIINKSIAGM